MKSKLITIEELRIINKPENFAVTNHAQQRLSEREIKLNDVMQCVNNGKIIEQYENDKPLPSCLISGITENERYLHIVVSTDKEYIYLITAYYPNINDWSSDFTQRR